MCGDRDVYLTQYAETKTLVLSKAHIIRHKKDAQELGVSCSDGTNVLILCGTKGQEKWVPGPLGSWIPHPTCHDLFDNHKMAFKYNGPEEGDDARLEWQVVGGPYDGKTVHFESRPHRRSLHSHLVQCLRGALSFSGACDELKERMQVIATWRPSVEMAGTLEKDSHTQCRKRKLDDDPSPTAKKVKKAKKDNKEKKAKKKE